MKNIYYLIITLVTICACSSDIDELIDNPDSSENPDTYVPYVPNFPFETLDITNYNNATNILTAPPANVRLDSVEHYHYNRFNPESNNSNLAIKINNSSISTTGLPPVEPTNKQTQIFRYNNSNKVDNIDIYYSRNFNVRGSLIEKKQFAYNLNNNITHYRQTGYEIDDQYYRGYNYTHTYVFEYINESSFSFKEYSGNTFIGDKTINISENEVSINNVVYHNGNNGYKYSLDSFKNVLIRNYLNAPNENLNNYFYPKNIYNPFCNLFPLSFKPFMYYYDINRATNHLFSYYPDKYTIAIQLNSYGFPEIVQYGSYDDGYRTKYYYSIIN